MIFKMPEKKYKSKLFTVSTEIISFFSENAHLNASGTIRKLIENMPEYISWKNGRY